MNATFTIQHHPDPPAFYDIIIDRGEAVSILRIEQFDMLALLDGTEVKAVSIDSACADPGAFDEPVDCGTGRVRIFDAGSCAIERWSSPVYIMQIASRRFNGTFHVLKAEEGYSLRYLRNRANKPPLR